MWSASRTGEKRSDTECLDDKPVATHVCWFRNGQNECNQGQRIGKWMKWNAEGPFVENVGTAPRTSP